MFNADRPISSRAKDRFRRSAFADALTAQLLVLSMEDSFVIGLTGPWGSGKTSVLRMVEESVHENERVVILTFNPWLFSGTENLVAHFFKEVSAQLSESKDRKLNDIGEKLITYSEALSPLSAVPFVGEWVERFAGAGKFLGGVFKRKGGGPLGSVTSQRGQIERALLAYERRLWIVVDDIDRLSKADIRELFKLVRLTADFPGITYILAFDRDRVESALGELEGEGRAYLAKILQVTFEIPVLHSRDLSSFLLEELASAVGDRRHGPFDQTDWGNIFALAIAPLFRTPRDVRRYTNSIPVALSVVGEEIALADLLAIEAVRCLLPDTWSLLRQSQEMLTSLERSGRSREGADREKSNFEALLRSAGADRAVVEEMCRRVFPPTRRFTDNQHFGHEFAGLWRRERRLASAEVLRFYFEASFPSGVTPPSVVQGFFDKLEELEVLRNHLQSMDGHEIEDLCSRLEAFEDKFPAAAVEPATLAFLEQYPNLREGRQGFYDIGASFALTRLVLRLLRILPDDAARESVVRSVSGALNLSARRLLVDLVGWREGAGHKMVTPAISAQLEEALEHALLAADAQTLGQERDLLQLLQWADDGEGLVSAHARECASSDTFLIRLFRSGLSESGSKNLDDVIGTTTATLPWSYLRLLLGDDLLCRRVTETMERRASLSLDGRGHLALDTALKYRDGWRPNDPMRDVPVTDEPVEVLERRAKYDRELLVRMLQSVVAERRKRAVGRIAEEAERTGSVDSQVRIGLIKLILSESIERSERINAVEVIDSVTDETLFLPLLAESWLSAETFDVDLGERVAAALSKNAPRLTLLLDALDRIETDEADGPQVQHALRAVAAQVEAQPQWLSNEHTSRAHAVLDRFGAREVSGSMPKLNAGEPNGD